MNKRVVSLLLSVVMICCLLVTAVPAAAAENDGEGTGVIGGNPIGGLDGNYEVEPPEQEQDSVQIKVPFKLIMKKTGEMDPGKETFKFVLENFGAQGTEYAVVQDTVETNGEKTYDGEFVFTVNQSDVGNLEEGFVIRQVKGNAEGWTYDEAKYRVEPTFNENCTAVVSWRFLKADENGEFDYDNNLNEIVFTNSYNAKKPATPPTPQNPESPKTGDSSNLIGWLVALSVSGGVLTMLSVNSKKRKGSEAE